MLFSQKTSLPFWAGLIILLYYFVRMFTAWKQEQRTRKENNQPHTLKDDALLLLSALLLVGLLVTPLFFEPLRVIYKGPFGAMLSAGLFMALGAGLTYVFNRKKRAKTKRPRSSYGD